MRASYPTFLKDESADVARRMWLAHLNEFDDEAIESAASRMIEEHPTFAPTIGEFKLLCKNEPEIYCPAHKYLPPPDLPEPNPDSPVYKREIAKLRELLR